MAPSLRLWERYANHIIDHDYLVLTAASYGRNSQPPNLGVDESLPSTWHKADDRLALTLNLGTGKFIFGTIRRVVA